MEEEQEPDCLPSLGLACPAPFHVWDCPRVEVFLFPGRFFSR